MGMVLDELSADEKNVVKDNDVNLIIDERLKNYVNHADTLTIDFRETGYGSGFIITGGSTC